MQRDKNGRKKFPEKKSVDDYVMSLALSYVFEYILNVMGTLLKYFTSSNLKIFTQIPSLIKLNNTYRFAG